MAVLNIRNLPNDVHARLRVRAATHGRSMEAEARAIITVACGGAEAVPSAQESLQEMVDRIYGSEKPTNVVDELIAQRRAEASSE